MNTKPHLRQTIRRRRNMLSETIVHDSALQVLAHIQASALLNNQKNIGCYFSHQHEVDTKTLLNWLHQTYSFCYLPMINEQEKALYFFRYRANDPCKKNRYGILEPHPTPASCIATNQLDTVFVPLVAFDRLGNRLGMGAGFYDHTFAFKRHSPTTKPQLIGLAYDFQEVSEIPAVEATDVPLDYVITETRVLTFNRQQKFWLMKSEPDTFGIHHLAQRANQTEPWDGVRNYQARNMLRDQIKVGDLAFFYHSSCETPGIVGIVEIVKAGYPDKSAWDPKSPYHDPKSTPENPRWYCVDVKLKTQFERPITLAMLKQVSALSHLPLLQKGNRLSVLPIEKSDWEKILSLRDN